MTQIPLKILLVENSRDDARVIHEALSGDGDFGVESVDGLDAALRRMRGCAYDLVLLDLGVGGGPGLAMVAAVLAACGDTPLVVLATEAEEVVALKAVQAGAQDYLIKGQVFGTMARRAVLHAVERARADRALRDSEERYRLLARVTNDTIWEYDVATDRHAWNDDPLAGFGYSAADAPPRLEDWMTLVHPEDRAALRDAIAGTMDGGSTMWSQSYRFRRADGSYAEVLDRGYVTRGADGRARKMVGALIDLSDLRHVQEALRSSEERHRTLFETMAQGVIVVRRGGTIVDANPAARAFLGLRDDEMGECRVSDTRWDVVREDGSALPPTEGASSVALRTGCEVDGVVMGIWNPADERRHWLLVHARPHFRPGETEPYEAFTTITDITSLREAEAARKASEARLRLITDTVREAFYLIEFDPPRVVYLSSAFEQIWGVSLAELYEGAEWQHDGAVNRFQAMLHPDDRARVAREVARRLAGEELYSEYRIVRGDGEIRWIGDRSFPLRGADGKLTSIVGSGEDITARKLAEEELRRGQERLTRLFETVADGITITDRAGRITFVNRAAEETLGLARGGGDAFAHPGWRVTAVNGGPLPVGEHPVARVLATGAPVSGVEHAVTRPDGRRAVVSVNAAPLLGSAGEVEGVVSTIRDVTAARAAADRMRFQAALLDAVGEAVLATDLDGRIIFWNRHAELRSGWSVAEVMGKPVVMAIGTDSQASVADLMRAVTRGETWTGEMDVSQPGGGTYPTFVSAAPISSESGEVVGVVAACADLTGMKRLEEQLQQAQRMEAVGRLAGGVAHDFNNILTGIQGYSQFLIEELSPDDPLRGDAEEILRASERAAGLTRQLLAFSRKQVLQPRVLDLGAVVAGMRNMVGRLIGEDVRLDFDCQPGLGRVRADPGQIEQVVMNLAVNARDAMPGGGQLALELRNDDSGDGAWVVLRVRDSGTGISPDVLPHVFEPFFTTKEVGRGTGLGLSTVYGIVVQSGGRIEARSEPGTGTTFEVFLPRVEEVADRDDDDGPVRSSPGRGETVLLVEDEPAVRMLGARVLRRMGYLVLEAQSGAEALRICEGHPGTIDLLVTDVVMPEMSGSELAERVATVRPGLRTLFVSGYTADMIARHGVLEEGRLFLEKPFSPQVFADRVRRVLDLPPGMANA